MLCMPEDLGTGIPVHVAYTPVQGHCASSDSNHSIHVLTGCTALTALSMFRSFHDALRVVHTSSMYSMRLCIVEEF